MAQVVERQRSRESAGVPDFETVGEETDLNRGVTVVISMGSTSSTRSLLLA